MSRSRSGASADSTLAVTLRSLFSLCSACAPETPGRLLVHVLALSLALLVIALAGQPIYANDTWIHLALGKAFASQGPWLVADPHLYAAPGPPSPSSWLGSLAIFEIQSLFGFVGLRVFHAALVGVILALAWVTVRRATGSKVAASSAVPLFIILSTYRLVQLRPDLFSIAATLLLFLLLIAHRSPPGATQIAGAVLLSILWSNLHAAFLLGPLLVLGVSMSLFALAILPGGRADPEDRRRATRLGLAGGLMLMATVVNPQGWKAHLAYFMAGDETPGLGTVIDEWGPTNLLAAPLPNLPPTWAAWLVCWLCVVATAWGTWRLLSELRVATRPSERTIDPALLALAVAGIAAAVLASRFLWLGIFAVAVGGVLVARVAAVSAGMTRWLFRSVAAIGLLAACGLYFSVGDWVLVSRSFRAPGADYRVPYYPGKFDAHAVWFLADSGLEGRIYNDYPLGGFMSFWLAPKIQMSSSGTMNVAREAMLANLAIASRARVEEGEDFAELLDRQGLDLFLGTGLPIEAIEGRRDPSTLHHLEGEAGWILVFRSLRSAVYLRRNERNAENLARIRDYYSRAGVPFDPEQGFDPERVITQATDWAVEHGVAPADFVGLVQKVREVSRSGGPLAPMNRLATFYATLGLYERALAVDEALLRLAGGTDRGANAGVSQRQVWLLLRLARDEEALATIRRLDEQVGPESIRGWRELVEQILRAAPADRARVLSFLPLFHSADAAWAQMGMTSPAVRVER